MASLPDPSRNLKPVLLLFPVLALGVFDTEGIFIYPADN